MKSFLALALGILLLAARCPADDAGTLKVELVRTRSKLDAFFQNVITVRFTNTGRIPVRILAPLDGSTEGFYAPSYLFSVRDASESPIPMLPRICGLSGKWSGTTWPEDYVIVLGGLQSHEIPFHLRFEVPKDGPYSVGFQYVVKDTSSPTYPIPNDAWRGVLRAPDVHLDLKAAKR